MSSGQYKKTFWIVDPEFTCRFGRAVNIPDDLHRTIRRIVSIAEVKGLTISGYIANVLREHISEYKDDIRGIFEEGRTPTNYQP